MATKGVKQNYSSDLDRLPLQKGIFEGTKGLTTQTPAPDVVGRAGQGRSGQAGQVRSGRSGQV